MALTQVGNRVYARITDLSEESVINDGDKLIFHSASSGNASLIDWSNVKIDLAHTTFGTQFSSILEFTQNATAWVDTMTESFEEVESRFNDVAESVTKMNNELSAIKMLLQLLLGMANGQDEDAVKKYISVLNSDAQAAYYNILAEVSTGSGVADIDFVYNNILYCTSIPNLVNQTTGSIANLEDAIQKINQQIIDIYSRLNG